MNKKTVMFFAGAVVAGSLMGLLWVQAASGPSPSPVTELQTYVDVLPTVVGPGGSVSATGQTTIVGGPSPATADVTYTGADGVATTVHFQTTLKQDGTWGFNLPMVPAGTKTGMGTVKATINAGGQTASDTVSVTVAGGDFTCNLAPAPTAWVYENDAALATNNQVTLTASVVNLPSGSPALTYAWKPQTHPHTGLPLVLVSGGGPHDTTATFKAPQAPGASTLPYVVTCGVTADFGAAQGRMNSLGAVEVTVRKLGDANGDGKVTGTDFSVWKLQNGQSGAGLTADFNGDGKVTGTDFSIWKKHNGETTPR